MTRLTIGWSIPAVSEKAKPSEEELVQLQKQIGEALEERLDPRTIGEGCRFVMLPIQQRRLCLLLGSKQPLEIFHLKQLSLTALEALSAFHPVKNFIHVGSVRELGKEPLTVKQIADGLRQGLDGLAAYFYKPDSAIVSKHERGFRRLEEEQIREWSAAVIKALQRENAEAFQEAAGVMTQLSDPPIHPVDLLRLTKQMFHPGFVKLPTSVIERLSGIDQLDTWTDYCEWWAETTHAISEWLNNRFHPPATVRKEVQIMCRYIREHYKEDVQVVELAELVQMHPSYAGQMFKQEVGENVSEYLNRVRMEKASELLERTTMKIYEVSGAVGISDYRYFCKLFKSYTGFTPTKYKNREA
ncbi:Arabinose operon regulatory protein [compost metagenome]